ncbi:MAG TPA: YceI family protein [Candidatus Binatia bacterium]|nr:YceI family protein [Candidatus Binatia bacterium]
MGTQIAEKTTYAIDPAHTTVEFVVRHLMITKVRGRFGGVAGSIEIPAGSDVPSAVAARIDATTIDTREPQRDAHLKSADFFEVEKYPEIEFVSTRIEGDPGDFTVHGNLTIHGVTREVALEAAFEGRSPDPWGGQRIGYSASTTINRKDFGLTWNAALETGGVVVGDDIRIELEVQAVLQK